MSDNTDHAEQNLLEAYRRMGSPSQVRLINVEGPTYTRELREETVRGICDIAGIKVERVWKLVNSYWPLDSDRQPHWLIKCQYGMLVFGPRKKVYAFDWEGTGLYLKDRTLFVGNSPSRDTSWEYGFHAWDLITLTTRVDAWKKWADQELERRNTPSEPASA